ncbi:MAG: hypothetical protein JSW61_04805 [Candidatus Thorarchaeota archaeon]|nr:MAG: hypothetical protein JSW61_04805 [Candidatus Thorarchaeota archaeon]
MCEEWEVEALTRVAPMLIVGMFLASLLIVPPVFVFGGYDALANIDGPFKSQALLSQLPHNARIAIYDEDNLTVPVISDGLNFTNNIAEITTLLEGAGHTVEALTEEDILNHDLITADYDVFIMVNNVPRPSIEHLVKEFSLGGGGLLTFHGAVSYLWYGGYIFDSLDQDLGHGVWWGYFSSDSQNITSRHPTMKAYHVNDTVYERANSWATSWEPKLVEGRGNDMIFLMNNASKTDFITAFAIDNHKDGGRIVQLPGDGSSIPADFESIILDSVEWLVPKPRGRIVFDLSHSARIGIDPWDVPYITVWSSTNNFGQFRNLAANHSYTFDKLYPSATGNLTAERLANYDVLVVNWPDLDYTAAERVAVEDWVAGGGSLLVLGDRTGMSGGDTGDVFLNQLLQNFDMSLGTTDVLDFASMTPASGGHLTLESCTSLSIGYRNYLVVIGNATEIWMDGTDIVVAGEEFGRGRAILSADMNIFDNDFLGEESNVRFALNVLNWLSSTDAEILVHTDYLGWNDAVCKALRDLGLSYSLFNTRQYLDDFVDSQSWGLLIYNNVNYFPESTIYDELYAFVNTGGSLILTSFDVDSHPTHPLWSKMGVEWSSSLSGQPSMYIWEASHPVFTEPNNHSMYDYTSNAFFADDGDTVVYFEGHSALAGTTATAQNGSATIVVSDDRKTLFNTIIIDNFGTDEDDSTYADSVELWQNEIVYMMTDPTPPPGDGFPIDTTTLLIIVAGALAVVAIGAIVCRKRGSSAAAKPRKRKKK